MTAVGVDDFALRRGYVYGTVLVDMTSHRPLDVLPDRTADTLKNWLVKRPEVQVVCRDRAGAYAEGARAGAPEATQVADRWHLWHNLAQAVEKTVIACHGDLHEPLTDKADDPEPAEDAIPVAETVSIENRLAVRTRERYAAICGLRDKGLSISVISRQLDLDRKTVHRFTEATSIEQLLVRARTRGSLLDAFKPYLHERFNAGITDAAALTAEIQTMGYRGSQQTVRRYLHPFRVTLVAPPPVPVPPTVQQVTGWLTRHPDSLTEEERLELKKILDRSPVLATTQRHVREFAEMLTQRHGERPRRVDARRRQ